MNIKRLVLGTAAGALAVTGAHAADLPVVVEPVDYVRICDAFGTGFYSIPGTETCLRVSGRIRADYNVYFDDEFDNSGLSTPNFSGFGYGDDFENGYRFRARGYLYMDSRTSTEFGLLRTFMELHVTRDFATSGFSVNLNRAFIQFGGLTFGRTQSFFDFTDGYYGSFQTDNPSVSDTTTQVLAYTAAFGNGFSASLSIEDETFRRSGIANGVYQGTRIPDVVANLRVEQGWGSAQVMGATHYIEEVISGEEALGFAIGAGVNFNVPFGSGTTVGIQGTYAHGALRYLGNDARVLPSAVAGTDAFVDPISGDLELADGFSVHGGFSTSFTPTVSLTLGAGYTYVDYENTVLAANGTSADFSNFDVDGFLGYSPVSGFVMGVGAQYKYQDTDEFGDASSLTAFFRAQRTF